MFGLGGRPPEPPLSQNIMCIHCSSLLFLIQVIGDAMEENFLSLDDVTSENRLI
jgi:hypothetical protein